MKNSKEILTTRNIFNNPDVNHVISHDENTKLFNYFRELDDDAIENVVGLSIFDAASIIGCNDFKEETLQHILCVIFSDKYEGYY